MKRFLPAFLLIIIVLAVYPFLGDKGPQQKVSGLPWQIDVLEDGATRVFGIVLGRSSLAQAHEALGRDTELAVMQDKDGSLSLEMYLGHYRAGLLSGKLVLLGDLDDKALAELRDNSPGREIMESTARKFLVEDGDRPRALAATVRHIAFIPAVNLDEEIITKRFGEAAEVLAAEGGVTHYLYPQLGLDIVHSDELKEVLQYVAPGEFDVLVAPLKGGG